MPRSKFKRGFWPTSHIKPHQSQREKTRRIEYMYRGGDAGQENMWTGTAVRPGKTFTRALRRRAERMGHVAA